MGGRKAYSCIPCRSKKVKCDRHRLCGYCAKRSIQCVWPENGVTIEDEMEASPSPPTPVPPVHTRPLHQYSLSPSTTRPETSYSATRSSLVDVPQTVVQAEQLDHSILNDARIEPVDQDTVLSENHGMAERVRSGAEIGGQKDVGVRKRKRAFPFFSGSKGGDGMVTDELLENLPTRAECDILLRVYLEKVEWIHHPLHLPAFLAQYNKFWSMSPSQRRVKVHSRWTALLFIVLCLGEHFGDEEMGKDGDLEERLLVATEDSLSHSDFLDQPSTETIQTIICLNLYLNNKNKVNAARSLLGTAIKMAISIGMSRIPDEGPGVDPQGIVDRELGRRLWWSLVTQDAYTASTSGFTYLINLSHTSTSVPSNLNDDDILPPPHFHPKPLMTEGGEVGEVTTATYHITKVDFALVVRAFVDLVNRDFPNADYEGIMALDLQFRQVYASLPPPLRPDLPQPFSLSQTSSQRYLLPQRLFSGITLHNRIMRLHRAYMVRGYAEDRFEYSTRACLESAYALLGLVRQERGILCRWWVVLVQVWTGGLIIGVDLLRGRGRVGPGQGGEEGWGEKQREALGVAVSLLEPISKSSPVAARGVKVLRALIASSFNPPPPPPAPLAVPLPPLAQPQPSKHPDDSGTGHPGESRVAERGTSSHLRSNDGVSSSDRLESVGRDGEGGGRRNRHRVERTSDSVKGSRDMESQRMVGGQLTDGMNQFELGHTSLNDLDLLLQNAQSFVPSGLEGEVDDPAAAEFWESLFGMGQW